MKLPEDLFQVTQRLQGIAVDTTSLPVTQLAHLLQEVIPALVAQREHPTSNPWPAMREAVLKIGDRVPFQKAMITGVSMDGCTIYVREVLD